MPNLLPVLGIILLVGFLAIMVGRLRVSRAKAILRQWAAGNRYQIVSAEHRLLRVGPFWWRKTEHQEIYYVTIRTPEGQVRRGWVRCGGWFLGLGSNCAVVEWDE
jgi:hypothetical protein